MSQKEHHATFPYSFGKAGEPVVQLNLYNISELLITTLFLFLAEIKM